MHHDKKLPRLEVVSPHETGFAHHLRNMSLKELLEAMNMIYEIETLIDRTQKRKGIKRKYFLN